MNVASGGIARSPRQRDHFTALHILSDSHQQFRVMAVSGVHVVPVVNGDPHARMTGPSRYDDSTGFAGVDRRTTSYGIVLSNVNLISCTGGIRTPTIGAGNSPSGDRVHQLQVSGKLTGGPYPSGQ